MKIFVTGASGFVGGAITSHLKEKHQILAMARSPASQEKIKALGAEAIACDLFSITSDHLAQVDIVIHAAARAEEWGSFEQFYQANVVGTQNMLMAAKAAGVKRFIFVGTEAALFKGQDLHYINESYPYALDSPYPYSQTKAMAEKQVLEANSTDFETLSLRPRMVWGPNDQSILPAILDMLNKGAFVWVANGQALSSSTYIGNFVHAIELALDKGVAGEAYFITDKEISSIKTFFTKLVSTRGMTIPEKSIPSWLVRSSAYVLDHIWKGLRLKTQPPISRMAAGMMSSSCTLSTKKAQKDLGYAPLFSVEEGFRILCGQVKDV